MDRNRVTIKTFSINILQHCKIIKFPNSVFLLICSKLVGVKFKLIQVPDLIKVLYFLRTYISGNTSTLSNVTNIDYCLYYLFRGMIWNKSVPVVFVHVLGKLSLSLSDKITENVHYIFWVFSSNLSWLEY